MTDQEFSTWVYNRKPSFEAFGKFVIAEINSRLSAELGKAELDKLLKIQPSFRVKDRSSAMVKQASKKYPDPTYSMTDLVGVRFVVLLKSDISIVERIITTCDSLWTARRDREPKMESDKNPDAFRYQSVHYVIRNITDINVNGIEIPAEITCEIQIRTLLQHAYAELGHDRIYKGDAVVPPSVHRIVARSMALMETTDNLFCEAVEELNRVNKGLTQWCSWLDNAYMTVGPASLQSLDDEDSISIIETYRNILATADTNEVAKYFSEFAVSFVKSRAGFDDLFSKPVILLVYWLIKMHSIETVTKWPLPKFRDNMEAVAVDLGISIS